MNKILDGEIVEDEEICLDQPLLSDPKISCQVSNR